MNLKYAVVASVILATTGAANAQNWGGAPVVPQRQSTGNLSGNGYVGSEMRSGDAESLEGCTIVAISVGTDDQGGSNLAGKLLGGILGGLAGHAMGGGNGKTATTVVGAAGGAMLGNAVESKTNTVKSLTLNIRMPNGVLKPFTQDDDGTVFALGQSVIVMRQGKTYRVVPAPVAAPVSLQSAPLAAAN